MMCKKGARLMAELIADCNITHVNMSRCDQLAKEISAFAKGLGEYTLQKLDITTHELMKYVTKPYVEAISKLFPCVTDEITMIDWTIDEENKDLIQKYINTFSFPEFKLIYAAFGAKSLSKNGNS